MKTKIRKMANSQHDISFNVNFNEIKAGFSEIRTSIDGLNKSIDRLGQIMADGFAKGTAGTRRTKQSAQELGAELDRLIAKQQRLASQGTDGWRRNKQEIDKLEIKIANLRKQWVAASNAEAAATNKVTQAQSRLNNQVSLGRQLFLRLKSVMLTVFGAYAIINGIRNTINTIKDFELSMARLQSITGRTREEIDALGASNKLLSAKSIFNATEIADAQLQLAKFGFSLDEIIKSTPGIIKLATATGEELGGATTLVSSSLRALGLDAAETTRLVDVLGKAFVSSALDVDKFRESSKYLLPLARQMGWTIEEVSAVLSELANSGISGSLAGTGLRQTFIELFDVSSDLSKVLGTGIKTFDQFFDAIQQAKDEGVAFSKVLDAIPVRAKTLFSALWNGANDIERLKDGFDDATGSINQMANVQMNTLAYQMERFKGAWDAYVLSLKDNGGWMMKFFRGMARYFTESAYAMNPLAAELALAGQRFDDFVQDLNDRGLDGKWVKYLGIKDIENQIEKIKGLYEEERELYDRLLRAKEDGTLTSVGEDELKRLEAVFKGVNSEISKLENLLATQKIKAYVDADVEEMLTLWNALKDDGVNALDAFEAAYKKVLETGYMNNEGEMMEGLIQIRDEMNKIGNIDAVKTYDRRIKVFEQYYKKQQIILIENLDLQEKVEREALKKHISVQRELNAIDRENMLKRANRINDESEDELAQYIAQGEQILLINREFDKKEIELDKLDAKIRLEEKQITNDQYIAIVNAMNDKLLEIESDFDYDWLALFKEYSEKVIDREEELADNRKDVRQKVVKDLLGVEKVVGDNEIKRLEIAAKKALYKGGIERQIAKEKISQQIEMKEKELEVAEATDESISSILKLQAEIQGLYLDLELIDTIDFEDQIGEYKKLASEVGKYLEDIADAHVENTERIVDDLDTRISEVQRDLERETELYMEGYANNVTAKKKELEELRKAREQAIRERERAISRQQALESLSQSISLGTAIADVLKTYAGIPGAGVVIAAGVIGAILALFSSMKAKASSLARYGEGGEVKGKPHAMGGEVIEAEGGEFVVRKEQYAKYGALIRAINEDNLPKLDANIINNTSFGKQSNVVVSTKEWGEIRDLLKDNLRRENVEVVGNKKIVSRGIKKRIINV